MRYLDVSPDFREKFARFAFADRRGGFGDVLLNVQHNRGRLIARTGGGGLELRDAPDALRMLATLDRTRDADDALRMVGRGLLRGLSVEFRALLDRHTADGLRVVQRAKLFGIGVVDAGAYPAADVAVRCLELRRGGRALDRDVFKYGQRRTVSDRGTGEAQTAKARIPPADDRQQGGRPGRVPSGAIPGCVRRGQHRPRTFNRWPMSWPRAPVVMRGSVRAGRIGR